MGSLITDDVLSNALGSVAGYLGASLNSDAVVTGTPLYSSFGMLIDLTDGLNITNAVYTLDATKQTAITFKNSSGGTICLNPKIISLSGITAVWTGGSRTLALSVSQTTGTFVTNVSVFLATFAFIHSVITAVTGISLSTGTAVTPD
jgi:hypothetical protein